VAPLGFTEVVVTRNGGLDDVEAKAAFHRKAPVDIVQAAQHALHKASRNPPLILRGRWTENVAKTGNFVYRLAGDIPLSTILTCKEQLCEAFPEGDVWIVPTKGWTWVQLRGWTCPTWKMRSTTSMRATSCWRLLLRIPASRVQTSWSHPTSRATR
jgi:hypothetical protein